MKEISIRNDFHACCGIALQGDRMNKLVKKSFAALTMLALITLGLLIAGCGGGSGGISTEVVSGTAAVGDQLSGQVSLKDSSTPSLQKTAVIGSDGSFAIDVTDMKAPYVLQASGSAAGAEYKLLSFADGPGTANVNPLSHAIVVSAADDDDDDDNDRSDLFEKSDADRNHRIGQNLERTVSILLQKLQPLLKLYNAEHTNPITSRYIVNHLDLDDMFDKVKITVADGTLSIINKKSRAVIFSSKIDDIANGVFDGGALPSTAAVPETPAGLNAVGGSGAVTLSWASVSNATSYNVYYATSPGVTTTSGTKVSPAVTPFVQTGLSAGTSYYFVVTAVNSAGESAASAQVSAATAATPPVPTVPAAPAGLVASGGTNQVSLSWSAASTATSYNVYYSTTGGVTKTNGTKISSVTSPAVQTGLAAGTTYYYIVTAVNSAGEGPASVQVAATTLAAIPAPAAPAAPTGVSAAGGASQATISWPAVSGATSYNIYWSSTPGVTMTNGTKVAAATSPYVKTALSAGTTYYFIVTAANSVGESAASSQVTATTSAPPLSVPTAPTGVTAAGGANQVSISWAAVAGATSYNIYWSTAAGVTTSGTKITTTSSPYMQNGLAAATTYYYIVTAVNAAGQSVASAQVSAATNAPVVTIPAAPAGVSAAGGANQATISWSAVPGATSYNVYYATAAGVTKTNGAKIVNASSPYLQTGLAAGTTYYFIVTAVNSAGEGNASTQASAATNAPPATACGTCHAIPPATGEHDFHVNGQGIDCVTCHGSGYSSTAVTAATHRNGVINVSLSVWNATTRSCASFCHGSKSW
ncbi:MAG: Fibronectin, type domain protein [Deltaproteobacteria bacterium]|nr:Fibronectin, type domain protein [Deltaproteobacteria bacterium]